jgi:hypothetical protein
MWDERKGSWCKRDLASTSVVGPLNSDEGTVAAGLLTKFEVTVKSPRLVVVGMAPLQAVDQWSSERGQTLRVRRIVQV